MKIPSTGRMGLRLGIQEQCRFGIEDSDLLLLSKIIISCVNDEKVEKSFKNKAKKLTEKLTTIHYVLPNIRLP